MSYSSSIKLFADKKTLNIIYNELKDLKEANIGYGHESLSGHFREDCSGYIFDIAKKENLSFRYLFKGEETEFLEILWKNGIEISEEETYDFLEY